MKDFEIKNLIKPLLSSMRDFNDYHVKKQLESFLNNNSQIKMCYPFGEFSGSESFFDKVSETSEIHFLPAIAGG